MGDRGGVKRNAPGVNSRALALSVNSRAFGLSVSGFEVDVVLVDAG